MIKKRQIVIAKKTYHYSRFFSSKISFPAWYLRLNDKFNANQHGICDLNDPKNVELTKKRTIIHVFSIKIIKIVVSRMVSAF